MLVALIRLLSVIVASHINVAYPYRLLYEGSLGLICIEMPR